jgi:two-component system chemotaxis response regulator CheY
MKILIVDDSKAMRMIVSRTLRQVGIGEHTVSEASNGKEALTKLTGEDFDLVLCDMNMPEMSGLELLSSLKARGSKVKFGFITSEGTPAVRVQAHEAGALFLVSKPFTVESFTAAVRGVLLAA